MLLGLNLLFVLVSFLSGPSFADHAGLDSRLPAIHQFVTFGFLHIGIAHALWNIAFLALLAPRVESALGTAGLIAVYLTATLLSGVGFWILSLSDPLAPVGLGAGAAVAGVLGANFTLGLSSQFELSLPGGSRGRNFTLRMGIEWIAAAFVTASVASYFIGGPGTGWTWRSLAMTGIGFVSGLCAALTMQKVIETLPPIRIRDAIRPRPPEKNLTAETASNVDEGFEPAPPAEIHAGSYTRELNELSRFIDEGEPERALFLYHSIPGEQADAALGLTRLWRFAQLLIERSQPSGAITVMKRLLKRFPHGRCSSLARYELGLLYARDPAMRIQAIAYLREALFPRPMSHGPAPVETPEPVIGESRIRALETLVELGEVEFRGDLETVRLGTGSDESSNDPFLRGMRPRHTREVDLGKVFGDDLAQAALPPAIAEASAAPPPQRQADLTPSPIPFDAFAEDSAPPPGKGNTEIPSRPVDHDPTPIAPGIIFGEASQSSSILGTASGEGALLPPDLDSSVEVKKPVYRARKVPVDLPPIKFEELRSEASGAEEKAPSAPPPASNPSPAEAVSRPEPRVPAENARYAIVLPPGAQIQTEAVIGFLAAYLGMSHAGAAHALRRQHGILARNLGFREGADFAGRLAAGHQEVLLVEEEERFNFGAASDARIISCAGDRIEIHDERGRAYIPGDTIVAIGCGKIGEPGREVIDLYTESPARHIRLWRSTLKIESGGKEEPERFNILTRELIRLAPRAVKTPAVVGWSRGADPGPSERFASIIEYETYNYWFILTRLGLARSWKGKEAESPVF